MLKHDIPLNQGCLMPIKVIIPKDCFLSPYDGAAVVGGNVLTSQRIVDVIFKAFNICAASQGCMNNITFGNDEFCYYETVAGGSGAGPSWNGRHGVHTHMTNTRITDVEIMENRYPIIIRTFCIRDNSGGDGYNKGGNGLVREYSFRQNMSLCVLSERRVFSPYGINKGEDGQRGRNTLILNDGKLINLSSKAQVFVERGVNSYFF
jgi:5-oxoprolinase (ATP-hydrolysing)